MISPELLITQLIDENEKLKKELEQAQKDIKDFEVLAVEWKDGYNKMKRSLEIKIEHLEQTLQEVRLEMKELYESKETRD